MQPRTHLIDFKVIESKKIQRNWKKKLQDLLETPSNMAVRFSTKRTIIRADRSFVRKKVKNWKHNWGPDERYYKLYHLTWGAIFQPRPPRAFREYRPIATRLFRTTTTTFSTGSRTLLKSYLNLSNHMYIAIDESSAIIIAIKSIPTWS